MKLSRRRAEPEADVLVDQDETSTRAGSSATKGRPTPKRRDVVGPRGPVTAPKTRKEAYARQKAQSRLERSARTTSGTALTPAQRRAAVKSGDPNFLPRRDQGPERKLARNYVDSRRMASNYLLILFPLLFAATLIPGLAFLQLFVLVLFVGFVIEWYAAGRRVRALSIEREGAAEVGAMTLGFYAGSRAYLPRRWRMPAPQVELGDEI